MYVEGFRTKQGCYRFRIPTEVKPEDVLFYRSDGLILSPKDFDAIIVPDGLEIQLSKPLPVGGGVMTIYGFYTNSAVKSRAVPKKK